MAGIQPPDFETRLAILKAKAEQQGVSVPSDVLELIAHRGQQSVRELEGSLNRVIAYARLTIAQLTPELAAKAIKDIAGMEGKRGSISPHLAIEVVADSYHLTPQDLKSRKRDKEIALARQVAMYLLRQETNCSLAQIGKELGDRDHHVVSHAHKKIASEMVTDANLRDKILDIRRRCSSPNPV